MSRSHIFNKKRQLSSAFYLTDFLIPAMSSFTRLVASAFSGLAAGVTGVYLWGDERWVCRSISVGASRWAGESLRLISREMSVRGI